MVGYERRSIYQAAHYNRAGGGRGFRVFCRTKKGDARECAAPGIVACHNSGEKTHEQFNGK
ncbi:hypothetical protein E1890_18010 [Salmonella enterica subsp. enterica serovar Mountpleasant]|nr:hypothetical protein [Salmonella enterica subsp. enterica serovar Mountpleasant]